MPTDPTLLQLLADQDPAVRLIAADRAAECGEPLIEAWLRVAALSGTWAAHLSRRGHAYRLLYNPYESGAMLGAPMLRLQEDGDRGERGYMRWSYSAPCGWRRWYRRGDAYGSRPDTPSPGLEAAVLAVLTRRLGELAW